MSQKKEKIFKRYSHKTKWKCNCGKTFWVYYNQYGTSSGAGSCECGARVVVN